MSAARGNGHAWIWPSVIGGGVALVNAFWIVVWGAVNAETGRLQKEIDKYYYRAEEIYTKRENTEQYRQRVAVEIANLKTEHERLIQQVRRMRDDVISRDAYNGRHDALIEDVKRSNIRIDELRKDFGSSYTLSDKIKELQEQIKLLQVQGYNRKEKAEPSR